MSSSHADTFTIRPPRPSKIRPLIGLPLVALAMVVPTTVASGVIVFALVVGIVGGAVRAFT